MEVAVAPLCVEELSAYEEDDSLEGLWLRYEELAVRLLDGDGEVTSDLDEALMGDLMEYYLIQNVLLDMGE